MAVLWRIRTKGEIEKPRYYLLQSARNIAIGMYRDMVSGNRVDVDEDLLPTGKGDEIKEAVEADETIKKIREVLMPPDAEIFILKEGYELTFIEISKRLGLGEDLVYYRYKKALKKLRKEFRR